MPLSSRALIGVAFLVSAFASAPGIAQAEESSKVVSDGNRVSIEYTLKLADGSTADTNVGGEALVYVQGQSQILPALEAELLGLKIGDSKQVSLTAAQGYGEVDPGLFQTVPASAVPEGGRKVGTELVAETPSGQRVVRVHEVKGEEIVMDLNHPLAGQALEFDIKIVAIE
ncbi:MAG: peptidylprolyl isomerase [Myxococcota bacterium]|nr:peptidylprolyl isomerase [Myxococcota bacterium]